MANIKAKVMAHLRSLGATVDGPQRDPTWGSYHGFIDAPHRKLWSHTFTHCVARNGDNAAEFWANAWSDIGDEGLVDCDDPECDVCVEENDVVSENAGEK